jgi:transposase
MVIERDFRKLALATQAELRRVAVAMVRAGKTRIEAAEAVGVNRRFVGQWVKAAAQSGEAALAGRPRGHRPGEQKALGAMQEDRLRDLIARGCPDQFGLSFALWTRQAVRALIARETGVWLSLSAVGRYLRAWGFTAQRRCAGPASGGTRRSERGWRTPIRRSPAGPRRKAAKSSGPTRPGFPIRSTTAAALPPEGRPQGSRMRNQRLIIIQGLTAASPHRR